MSSGRTITMLAEAHSRLVPASHESLDEATERIHAMVMTPSLRKFALTTHVTSSVGWVGSVAAFLALAIAGVVSLDAQTVRAAYLTMP